MNTLLLEPTDVLFFRDGRPMSGALSGHGAAWPLPHTLNAALHAALWRAEITDKPWRHRAKKSDGTRGARLPFGALQSAGPFPVRTVDGVRQWYFPRPADAQRAGCACATLFPTPLAPREHSSLPQPLEMGVGNTCEPTKETPEPWISAAAYTRYLGSPESAPGSAGDFIEDDAVHTREHSIGIGISSRTGAQDGERFYSAQYLRLLPGWRLGMLTECRQPGYIGAADLTHRLFAGASHITIGGQQRTCTAEFHPHDWESPLPLPLGLSSGFHEHAKDQHLVKWVLLAPAIWPAIAGGKKDHDGNLIQAHRGGWLPNWITPSDGAVRLTSGPGRAKARRLGPQQAPGDPIQAKLVAAIVPKPCVVTGFGLPHEKLSDRAGPKTTHLAVPAGAVYYFSAASAKDAISLAQALNWHGRSDGRDLCNRRSTLCGEKGFGLGVCGTWTYLNEWPSHLAASVPQESNPAPATSLP